MPIFCWIILVVVFTLAIVWLFGEDRNSCGDDLGYSSADDATGYYSARSGFERKGKPE